jgi:hypothetical protein
MVSDLMLALLALATLVLPLGLAWLLVWHQDRQKNPDMAATSSRQT